MTIHTTKVTTSFFAEASYLHTRVENGGLASQTYPAPAFDSFRWRSWALFDHLQQRKHYSSRHQIASHCPVARTVASARERILIVAGLLAMSLAHSSEAYPRRGSVAADLKAVRHYYYSSKVSPSPSRFFLDKKLPSALHERKRV